MKLLKWRHKGICRGHRQVSPVITESDLKPCQFHDLLKETWLVTKNVLCMLLSFHQDCSPSPLDGSYHKTSRSRDNPLSWNLKGMLFPLQNSGYSEIITICVWYARPCDSVIGRIVPLKIWPTLNPGISNYVKLNSSGEFSSRKDFGCS